MKITEYRATMLFNLALQDAYVRTDEYFSNKGTVPDKREYTFVFRLTLCENELISNSVADIINKFRMDRNYRDKSKYPREYALLYGC